MPIQAKTFAREERYLVIKNSDLNAASLTSQEKETLSSILTKVTATRRGLGKPPMQCVVVESDWPEYGPVYSMIEQRIEGASVPAGEIDAFEAAALAKWGYNRMDLSRYPDQTYQVATLQDRREAWVSALSWLTNRMPGMSEFWFDLARSKSKYPCNARMFDGLMGEVDELRKAYLGNGNIREEAFDVAACAFRIATEGDAGGNLSLLPINEDRPDSCIDLGMVDLTSASTAAWKEGVLPCQLIESIAANAESVSDFDARSPDAGTTDSTAPE